MNDETCRIIDCERPIYVKKRGWCKIHYERWQYRKGDPEPIYQKQEKGHNMVNTPEWRAWRSMRVRCNNPNYPRYKDWGGRGIRVCKEWENSFLAFYKDVGDRPSDRHSLDRIDNDGNYEPANVKWSTYKEQNNNQRGRVLTVNK